MFGNGHPVLFIHGFLESLTMWEVLNLKQFNCCCIVVDVPGHGLSELRSNENEIPSIRFFAQELQQLLLHLKIEEFDIVGHSMGGYIGLEMMKLNSNVRNLMLLNSNFWADTDEKKKDRVAVADLVWKQKSLFLKTAIPNLFFAPASHTLTVKAIIEEGERLDSFGIAYASLAMRNRIDFSQFVAKNIEKIMVIQGVNDPIVKVDVMQKAVPRDLNVIYLENCGHMSHFEQTDAVTQALVQFMA